MVNRRRQSFPGCAFGALAVEIYGTVATVALTGESYASLQRSAAEMLRPLQGRSNPSN